MGYSRRLGRRPVENASKSSHSAVANDPAVRKFLEACRLPATADDVSTDDHVVLEYQPAVPSPIRHIVAVDSGYSEVAVKARFPSSTICFFQFGVLTFSVSDLEQMERTAFIDPEDMAKLKRVERLKLTLPVRNVGFKEHPSLSASVRAAIYDFFQQQRDGGPLMDTLRWFVYEEYSLREDVYVLASCPECEARNVGLRRADVSPAGRVPCSECGQSLYLTDVFRLHEAVDEVIGAGGILGYVTTLVEQIVLVHFIRLILLHRPSLLKELLFIKDGPLAFFGQTANMHKKMRALVGYLFGRYDLFMVGLEKSGAFVDHAAEIASKLKPGTILLLDNDYIYRYIIPGRADPGSPYGGTTYYSAKAIFKSPDESVYVMSIPTLEPLAAPAVKDIRHLMEIATNVAKLRCDMYDDALLPIALVNKLVSLSNHPSANILQRFAIDAMIA